MSAFAGTSANESRFARFANGSCPFRPLIDWALPRLLIDFPGATGNGSNLRKALEIAKFTSNFKALANMERE